MNDFRGEFLHCTHKMYVILHGMCLKTAHAVTVFFFCFFFTFFKSEMLVYASLISC